MTTLERTTTINHRTAHAYGLCHRPPMPGAVPRGWIPIPGLTWNQANFLLVNKFGAIVYDEPLTDEDVKSYELVYIGPVVIDEPQRYDVRIVSGTTLLPHSPSPL